jgi:hypothetical protein
MYLDEIYSKICISRNLSHAFHIYCGLKQGYALSPLFFNFVLKYSIRQVQVNEEVLESNGTHKFPVYAGSVNILGENVNTIKKNMVGMLEASRDVGLEVDKEKTIYVSSATCTTKSQFTDRK